MLRAVACTGQGAAQREDINSDASGDPMGSIPRVELEKQVLEMLWGTRCEVR